MLQCYGRRSGITNESWWLDYNDDAILSSKFERKYHTPAGRLSSGWRICMVDQDGDDCWYEIDEVAVCRVIYAITVGADLDIIRESLEDFRVSDDE
jgi:hypothetical protein